MPTNIFKEAFYEAVKPLGLQARESFGFISDPDDWQYRSLVTNPDDPSGMNGLAEGDRDYFRRRARLTYHRSAVGGALPDILADRVIGAGADYKAADEEVAKVVERFVTDPYNDLDALLPKYAIELLIFGELFLPVFLTPENADARMGYLTPEVIETVIFDAGNAKRPVAVLQRRPKIGEPKRLWVIPHPDPAYDNHFAPHPALTPEDEPGSVPGEDGLPVILPKGADGQVLPEIADLLKNGEAEVKVAGYAFYHRVNNLVSGRGHSMYERIIGGRRVGMDWLKALEDWFFNTLHNAIMQGAYIWDVKIENVTADEAKALKEQQYRETPRPGSWFVHDQDTEIKAVSPELPDAAATRELLTGQLSLIGIAAGIPGHELGGEGDTNRSTAKESKSVSTNRAKRFQKDLAAMVCMWLSYQVDQKVHAGQLSPDVDRTVECVLSEVDSRDEGEVALSVKTAAEGMQTAETNNHVLAKDARAFLYSLMGQDLPTEEEFRAAQEEADQRKAEALKQAQAMNPQGQAPQGGSGGKPPVAQPGKAPAKAGGA